MDVIDGVAWEVVIPQRYRHSFYGFIREHDSIGSGQAYKGLLE